MTLLEALIIAAVLCLLEARNCKKRADLWNAIAELEDRKQSRAGEPHIISTEDYLKRTRESGK